jgi:hypothetical protein
LEQKTQPKNVVDHPKSKKKKKSTKEVKLLPFSPAIV